MTALPRSDARPVTAALLALCLLSAPALAEEVGTVGVDWIGNDILIEALPDPDVPGVTCHLAYFERSTLDRLVQGNWFEDPSNSSIACRQTGPITLGDVARGSEGEEIFSERQSLLLKTLSITRIYDEANNTLIYLAHAREVTEGSAKMSISTVPLWQAAPAP
ncbi:CreA family protein [Paragemmobacter ruber]|uniref:CREA protein n=1 Tax=Paragemmobacter ruber TaxID=1985673 RepID=A0ABW9Y9C4_9RHOB|nr:CreA family protein [Rhodobacter ruber]NBE08997.1 CREA protein [Rhodobacter ruber]